MPKVADPLSPVTFVNKIDVPTFMACQWTDEQTGGHCPDLAEHFTGTRQKWFTFTNGAHIDSLDPATFNRWLDFLELYVAKQPPLAVGAVMHLAAPLVFHEAMGIQGLTLPPDPVQLQPTYAGALAAFEAEKPIRVLFDSGAGGTSPGQPYPSFEESFSEFPIPGTKAKAWYLAPGGKLAAKAPARLARRRLHLERPRAAAAGLQRRHRLRRRRPLDRRRRPTTGNRPRPARPSPT